MMTDVGSALGHFVPSKAQFRPIFVKYIAQFQQKEVLPPGVELGGKL